MDNRDPEIDAKNLKVSMPTLMNAAFTLVAVVSAWFMQEAKISRNEDRSIRNEQNVRELKSNDKEILEKLHELKVEIITAIHDRSDKKK